MRRKESILAPKPSAKKRKVVSSGNQETNLSSERAAGRAFARKTTTPLLDKLKELECDAPPQLQRLISRARKLHLGSAEFRSRAWLILTAVQTADWLQDRPQGFLKKELPSRVCNPSVRRDNCIVGLYARGKATLDRARRVVTRFEKFASDLHSELHGGPIYPVDS